MAVNQEPLYTTPDTPSVDPKALIPPTPQLQHLVDFVSKPEEYIAARPNLQLQYQTPLLQASKEKNLYDSLSKSASKHVANLGYNKYNTAPVEYDNRLSQMYRDPEMGSFLLGRDNESLYDSNQSVLGDIARNSLGFGVNFAGTFASGITSTPQAITGIIDWATNGFQSKDFSKIYDTPLSRTITDWMDDMQKDTYNYRGQRELEAEKNPLLNMIPFYGNGFGDVTRSLGFGAGAAASILAEEFLITLATGGTGTLPSLAAQIGKLYKVGNLGKAASTGAKVAETLKALQATKNAVETTAALTSTGRAIWAGKLGARNIMSSLGEATFEAMETQKHLEVDLIQKYKDTHGGLDPTNEELLKLKQATTDAGNARYLLNVALLTATNAIEFDALFKTFPVSKFFMNQGAKIGTELGERGFQRIAAKEAAQEGQQGWFKTFGNKAKAFNPGLKIVAPAEGFEEYMQASIDEGTEHFADHKFNGREESASILDSVLSGMKKTITTNEGWSAIIQGMVAGGIQQVGAQKLTDYRNRNNPTRDDITNTLLGDLNPYFTKGDGTTDRDAINALFNVNSIGGTAQSKVDHTATMFGLQKKAREAIENGDQKKFQDYKDDLQFAFLNQFIRTNQTESLNDVLDAWQDLASNDPQAFQKQFGLDNTQSNPDTIAKSLAQLRRKGKEIKKVYDNVELTFPNRFKSKTPEYDQYDRYKTELAAQLFKYDRFAERINELEGVAASGYNHLQDLYDPQKFFESLQREKKGYEDMLSIPSPDNAGIDFKANERVLRDKLKKTDEMIASMNRDAFTQEEVRELFFNADDIFGAGTLRNLINADSILDAVGDIMRLKDSQANAAKLYQLLSQPKKGFNSFKQAEVKAEQKAEEPRKQQREQKQAEKKAQETAQRETETKQAVNANYSEKFSDLAELTGRSVEDLMDEFAKTGAEVNEQNIEQYVLEKLQELNPEPNPTTPESTESSEEDESMDVDDDELFIFGEEEQSTTPATPSPVNNESPTQIEEGDESLDVEDDELFIFNSDEDTPQEIDALQGYREGTQDLTGKYIRYNSGSATGTQDYRYIKNITSRDGLRIKADVIEFENGEAVDKGNKEFNLGDKNKFVEVVETTSYDESVRKLLAPPVVPPVPPVVDTTPKEKGKPLAYFQNFFVSPRNFEQQAIAVMSNPKSLSIKIDSVPRSKGNGAVIYEDNEVTIRSGASDNLSNGANEVYGFELTSDQGSLGYFRPLSSFRLTKDGKTETLYDIVDRSINNPNELDKIAPYIKGSVKDLQTTFLIERYLKTKAKNNKSVSIKSLQEAIGRELIFKPYFAGVEYSKTSEEGLMRLQDLVFDKSEAFIWNDRGVSYNFNETNPNLDIVEALNSRSSLFNDTSNFTDSNLASFLLFLKDSTGSWNAIPVRSIPVTKDTTQVKALEKQIQQSELEGEQLADLLNRSFFYQDVNSKGNFIYSNGKIQFLLQGQGISYLDPKGDVRDANQIRITKRISKDKFNIKDFYDSVKEEVEKINKGGTTKIPFKFENFRIQPANLERFTAENFNDFRVMLDKRIPFSTVGMNYQAGAEVFEASTTIPENVSITKENSIENYGPMPNRSEVEAALKYSPEQKLDYIFEYMQSALTNRFEAAGRLKSSYDNRDRFIHHIGDIAYRSMLDHELKALVPNIDNVDKPIKNREKLKNVAFVDEIPFYKEIGDRLLSILDFSKINDNYEKELAVLGYTVIESPNRKYTAKDVPGFNPNRSFNSFPIPDFVNTWKIGDTISYFGNGKLQKGRWAKGNIIRDSKTGIDLDIRSIFFNTDGWVRNNDVVEERPAVKQVIDPEPNPVPEEVKTNDPSKMSKVDAENFFKLYPDEKAQLAALRRDYKGKAKQILEQIQSIAFESLDPTTAEGANTLANQNLNSSEIFKKSDEEIVPSLKVSESQLQFLVQKALRECK